MIQALIGPWRSIAGNTISRTLAKTFSSNSCLHLQNAATIDVAPPCVQAL
jgi:hypothetical protein